MLSVLVAHSYFLRLDHKQWARARPYPPLATLQLAEALRKCGHDVALFDAMLADGVEAFGEQLRRADPSLVILYEDTFNFLSKMCLSKMREAACSMIGMARRADSRVVVAGPDASDAPEAYLSAGADIVLIGEGLSTLNVLVSRLDQDPRATTPALMEGLPGVVSRSTSRSAVVKAGPLLPQAQWPALPAWDLIDVERYRAHWVRAHGYFSLNMAASRGCSFRCNWCAKPIWGNRYLQRDAAEVAMEMAYLKRTLNPDHIWFADDIFGFRSDWVAEFARLIAADNAAIPFTIQTRADLVSGPMARALKDARCAEAWIGAESGSQRILDAMNKGTTVEEIASARARLGAEGIRVGFFIQLGYLGEQMQDILATRELIEAAQPDDIGVSVAYPLPGTRFHQLVKAQLQTKTHWQESSDLDMMFEGTYSSDFYRGIRDLLHDQVSAEQLRTPRRSEAYCAARNSVEQRWEALIASEHRFRIGSLAPDPMSAGARG